MNGEQDMDSKIELRVLELLFSRLCHDLISPVMAVNNGIELLSDDGGEMSTDICDLLTLSAGTAAARLQFYRIAYGVGGQDAAPIGLSEAGRLIRNLLEDEKIELEWPVSDNADMEPSRESMKIILNLILVGIESLPRGGILKISLNGSEIALSARGAGAAFREESKAAMSPDTDIEALTARSVQSYFLNYLIDLRGGDAHLGEDETDAVSFIVRMPA